jgi:hypothetical protein
VCLAGGPERVSATEASIRARRIHRTAEDPSLDRCRQLADELGASRLVTSYLPRLAAEARQLDFGERKSPRFDLEPLWRAAEALPWRPPPETPDAPLPHAPAPLLDVQLPAQRGRLSAILSQGIDRHPPDRLVLESGSSTLSLTTDDARRPLVRAHWTAKRLTPRLRRGWKDGHAVVRDDAGHDLELGSGASVTLLEDYAIWQRQGRVHVQRVTHPEAPGAEHVIELPNEASSGRIASCRLPKGHVIAVSSNDDDSAVSLHRLYDDAIEAWGTVERGRATSGGEVGSWSLSCDDAHARVAWAMSEPSGKVSSRLHPEFPEGGYQHIELATCRSSGCERRKARLSSVHAGWHTLGGWSSPWVMSTPSVYALGQRVLVVWQRSRAYLYRLAPLEDLEATQNAWIAEVERPDSAATADPRALAWPSHEALVRGGVAILLLREERAAHMPSFLVRFDDGGNATAIDIPPPPPAAR